MQVQSNTRHENEDLSARAAALFPERLPHAEHNRREWMRSVQHLRSLPGGSGWLLDAVQSRRTEH